ncbi:hypothetical protein CaCOL14_004392 [Colletotrichum acutatum]
MSAETTCEVDIESIRPLATPKERLANSVGSLYYFPLVQALLATGHLRLR